MTLYQLSRYYWALSDEAYWMGAAQERHEWGMEKETWHCLLLWAEAKHIAREMERRK